MDRHFWFVDDERTRWAVRLSQPYRLRDEVVEQATRIVFTSTERQISTVYPLQKDERELSKYELLELLAVAKRAAVGAGLAAVA